MKHEFEDHSWAAFIEATATRGPYEFFHSAMEFVDGNRGAGRQAIDLGCGGGADTRNLLARGWQVLAVDAEPEARVALLRHTSEAYLDRLEIRIGAFDEVELPDADLVYAQFSLPFAGDRLGASTRNALAAIVPRGAFVGQFIAAEDDWAGDPNVAVVDREWVERTFGPFTTLEIDERKHHGAGGPDGTTKHWHYFHVRARR